MTNTDKINGFIADAMQATETLHASRREICGEHNERIRKLRDFIASLMSARSGAEGELFDLETITSPEIKRLLVDPTHSL